MNTTTDISALSSNNVVFLFMYMYWDSAIVNGRDLPTQITKLEAMINFETCIELQDIFCKRRNERCDALTPKVSLFCVSLTLECGNLLHKTMFNYFSTNYNYQRINPINGLNVHDLYAIGNGIGDSENPFRYWKARAKVQKVNKMYFKFEKQGWFEEFE